MIQWLTAIFTKTHVALVSLRLRKFRVTQTVTPAERFHRIARQTQLCRYTPERRACFAQQIYLLFLFSRHKIAPHATSAKNAEIDLVNCMKVIICPIRITENLSGSEVGFGVFIEAAAFLWYDFDIENLIVRNKMTDIIETERLILRPLTPADADTAYHGWTGDPEVAKHVSWLPHHSINDTIEWLREIEWKRDDFGNILPNDNYIWGFTLKETGELFGSGGLIWEDEWQIFQVGYNIMKAHWNRGHTTEAMKAILGFAAAHLGIRKVSGGHAKENIASAKVLEKLGFVYDRDSLTPHVDGTKIFDSREYLLDLIQIKPATRDELYEIAEFLHDSWKSEYRGIVRDDFLDTMTVEKRHQGLKDWFDHRTKSYLAMHCCGKFVGAAVFGKSFIEGYPDDGEISAIYLHHDYIGKGYGHEFFRKIEETLATKGYRYLVLDVLTDNSRAVKFYEKHGYVKVDDRSIRLGDQEYPLTVFRKENKSLRLESDT